MGRERQAALQRGESGCNVDGRERERQVAQQREGESSYDVDGKEIEQQAAEQRERRGGESGGRSK